MHVLCLQFRLLPPGGQGGVELGSEAGVGQHQAPVHHRQTLVELQLHLQRVVLRQRQLARAQTPGRGRKRLSNRKDDKKRMKKNMGNKIDEQQRFEKLSKCLTIHKPSSV